MTRRQLLAVLMVAAAAFSPAIAQQKTPGTPRLTLPGQFFAVPGIETAIYFDNIVLTETPEAYRFTVTCDIGVAEDRRWVVTPTAEQVGDHPLSVSVTDADGKDMGQSKTVLKVVPADAGAGRELKILIVGDSLTAATWYSREMGRLLSQPGNPKWTMLGTSPRAQGADGVRHEGYGGWTWQRFATKYVEDPEKVGKYGSSPFVFRGDDGKPVLDVAQYLDKHFDGQRPDIITVLLGINDCFSAKPDDIGAIDAKVNRMFTYADKLVAAFRRAAPEADIGICITTPPNSRESGFEANYKGRYPRWGWKRIQHRLVERELEKFAGREPEQLFVVPTQLNLDPVDGYPENNGVHPNRFGYAQIGASIYCWVKSRLHVQGANR